MDLYSSLIILAIAVTAGLLLTFPFIMTGPESEIKKERPQLEVQPEETQPIHDEMEDLDRAAGKVDKNHD